MLKDVETKADLLIMCYKIINNYTCTQPDSFFTFSSTIVTRGNSRKLNKSHTSSARDGHTFSKRIIDIFIHHKMKVEKKIQSKK